MKHTTSFLLLLSIVLMWGLAWPINKIGLSYTSPTNYIELRFILGTLGMFFIALVSKNCVLPNLKDLPMIFAVGIFQMALLLNLSNYGLTMVGAGKATFLIFTTSIWIIPLSALFKKRMSWTDWLSLSLGLVGVLFLITPWKINWHQQDAWLGDILLLLGSFFWSIGILCARYMKWHRPPIQLLPWQLLLATIGTVAFACVRGISLVPESTDPVFIGSLLYTGFVSISLGYWAMIIVSKKLKPSITSLALIWVPMVSLITSCLFLNEEPTFSLISAVILIMIAVIFHVYSEHNHEKRENFKNAP